MHKINDINSLLRLSWQQFEILVADLYRQQGFRVVECGGGGADGGVDIRLYQKGKLTLVQCKHWNSRVGVKPVRELYGLMTAEQAHKGILVATSGFTAEALRFAANKPLELMDGDLLLIRLNRT